MSVQETASARIDPQAILVGVAGGLVSGLTGIGGGAILVPLMTTFLHVPQRRAHGTSLAIIILTGLVSAVRYNMKYPLDWAVVIVLASGSLVGVTFGARLMMRIQARQLRRAFGAFLLFVSATLLFGLSFTEGASGSMDAGRIIVGLVIGVVAGVLSGLLGIGGGNVMVPAMALIMGLEQHLAQGISLAVIVPTSLWGSYNHWRLGNVDTRLAMILAPAAAIAGLLGSSIAVELPGDTLRRLFGLVLVYFGGRMVLGK